MYIAHQRKKDKRQQSVAEHLFETAELSKRFAEKIDLPLCGELIGLLHDLGKYSDEFQEYISFCIQKESGEYDPDAEDSLLWKKGKIDHSTAGAQLLVRRGEREHLAFPYLRQILTLCITSHHGGLIDCLAPDGTDKYTMRMNKEDSATHLNEVLDKCDAKILSRVYEILDSDEILAEMDAPLKLVAGRAIDVGLITRMLFSCLLDGDRTNTIDFEYPENKENRLNSKYPDWENFITALENRLAEFSTENCVDEIRGGVSLACKNAGIREQGILTLTVPTGGGKTLASLRFALEHARKHKLDRVIYVIPYISIIDQNAREVQKVFKALSEEYGTELVLEHHSNLTSEKETTTQRLMAENWDAPIVYTTSVQLLNSLFNGGTRSARRMHNLAKSVLVFDEIQALPVKTVHLFNNAMNFLTKVCGSSVLLCTATQPLLHTVDKKKGAIQLSTNNEIMPDVQFLFEKLKRVEVIDKQKIGGLSDEEIAGFVKDELLQTGSVLVIVNTKKAAKDLYMLCKDFDAEVFHLSTNQCPQHRLELIDEIRELAKPDSEVPVVCISTQLIEAGVDVDFGSVIRVIAGLDSIAQAAGRCNRNGKRAQVGRMLLVNPVKENISMLEDINIGKSKAERVLSEYNKNPAEFDNSLLSPKAITQFFQYYFYERSGVMDYPVTGNRLAQDTTLLKMLGKNKETLSIYKRENNSSPLFPLRQSFKTSGELFKVIDSQAQGVIVPYGEGSDIITKLCASENIVKEKELLKQAQRYSVNCFNHTLCDLSNAGALVNIQDSGIFCLRKGYYDDDTGITREYGRPDFDGVI